MKNYLNQSKTSICVKSNGFEPLQPHYDFLLRVYHEQPQLRELFIKKGVVDFENDTLIKADKITYYQAVELITMVNETGWRKYMSETYFEE